MIILINYIYIYIGNKLFGVIIIIIIIIIIKNLGYDILPHI